MSRGLRHFAWQYIFFRGAPRPLAPAICRRRSSLLLVTPPGALHRARASRPSRRDGVLEVREEARARGAPGDVEGWFAAHDRERRPRREREQGAHGEETVVAVRLRGRRGGRRRGGQVPRVQAVAPPGGDILSEVRVRPGPVQHVRGEGVGHHVPQRRRHPGPARGGHRGSRGRERRRRRRRGTGRVRERTRRAVGRSRPGGGGEGEGGGGGGRCG